MSTELMNLETETCPRSSGRAAGTQAPESVRTSPAGGRRRRSIIPFLLLGLGLLALLSLPLSAVFADEGATEAEEPKARGQTVKRQPVLWEVSKEGYLIYLLGTIHVPDPRVLDLLPEVEAALARSSYVYGELDSSPEGVPSIQEALARTTIGPDGYSFKAAVGDELYKRYLAALVPQFRPVVAQWDNRKVWYMTLMLVQSEQLKLGLQGQVLDGAVLAKARAGGKTVGALEEIQEQLDLFDGLTQAEQVALLEIGLNRMDADGDAKRKSALKRMIDLYVQGDVEKIEAFMQDQATPEDQIKHKALLDKQMKNMLDVRNKRMVQRLIAKVEQAGPGTVAMAAVGTAHMPGDVGLLALLKQQGWTTKRIQTGDELAPLPKKPVPAGAGAKEGGAACGGGGKACGGGR